MKKTIFLLLLIMSCSKQKQDSNYENLLDYEGKQLYGKSTPPNEIIPKYILPTFK